MNIITPWAPPVTLYAAGHQTTHSRDYVNRVDAHVSQGPRRVLIKYSHSGEGAIYVNEQRFRVPAGHLFMIERPGPYRYCYEGDGEDWSYSFVSLYCASDTSLLPYQIAMSPVIDVRANPEIATELHSLVEAYQKGNQAGLKESLLAYQLYVHCINASRGQRESGSKAHRLWSLLNSSFRHDVSIAQCADDLGMSHEALSRSFKQEFGQAPTKFLLQLRLRRARRLLEAGEMSLTEIALDCGFHSANYFGRAFKSEVGQTPASYRKHPNVLG